MLRVLRCSGGKIAVGASAQEPTRGDGGPTGDGQTCSWEGTVTHAAVATTVNCGAIPTPTGYGPYAIGDEFRAPDRCNECQCTDRGIMCTMKDCAGGGVDGNASSDPSAVPCQDDAKVCSDGSAVGRVGPSCEFAPCPEEQKGCTMTRRSAPTAVRGPRRAELRVRAVPGERPEVPAACSAERQGSARDGDGDPFWGSCELVSGCSCEGADCTSGKLIEHRRVQGRHGRLPRVVAAVPGGDHCPVACTDDAKQCPDGSYVARVAPTCAFAPCPDEQKGCTMDAKICPDGSSVGRVAPNCEFAPCPGTR